VFTDGSCELNGTNKAIVGIGVYWAGNPQKNLSEHCPELQTNN